MKSYKNQMHFIAALGVLILVGCQQAGKIAMQPASDAQMSQTRTPTSSTAPADISVDQSLPGGGSARDVATYLPALDTTVSTERCAKFLDSNAINTKSDVDLKISGQSHNLNLKNIRTLELNGNSGTISVSSAISTQNMNGNSGSIFLNSVNVKRVSGNSSDELCINAKSVGSISGNSAHITVVADSIETLAGGAGDNRITANSIGTIVGNSSVLHIYKAKIQNVQGQSGRICLHDGALILDFGSSNSAQVSSDCL